ncbi:SPFH domain-containing protein [Methylobacterium radiotolerans]|jgi:regulator of protease activity HflC (stomatin/prohibitin superfamily)|uniref:SPFH domain-containing protein n=1 Tax=Methylobacterium TaxID=407 RepID=UPI00040222A4|nr:MULTISPECIES: SPFH domain-containing protein [Methylobacterium]GAN48327.1 membrane protease subunit, stomatin/prohibitin [Methylobacterium sp. ME121]MBN6821190.1 SPFH/Band 7/PHB domain protein [Methylobacterium organophilum]MCX4198646.1 SPFH/Band 7/PHB domain protein [Methylobacterium organophilum]MDE3746357.1 SPFH/Band 7/PHB domain protein [Methylobacterium radiotolerans]OXE40399.1 SPFH/Band 7/PHB domain protein [Methylobacterium radiotolerans]
MGLPFGLSVFAVGVAALAIVTLAAGVKIVPQGYVYTVERFGRYARSLDAGLGLITPFVERVGRKVNVMEQVIDVPSQQAFTRDNAGVTIDAVVFYQVLDAARASYEVSSLDLAATTLTMTNIRTVVGSMDLDQLLAHRDEINERLLRVMDAAASPWGVKINRIEIKDIVLPADLAGAMARQMKAEREKRASILEAEGQRAAEILRAEGRKQSAILEAEGRREAAFRDAEARERSAEAEATATGMVSRAIAEGDIAAANFLVAEKYVDAVRAIATAPNQRVVVVPIEAAALAGTLGGIGELTRSVFGDGAAAPRRTGTPPNVAAPRA